MKEKIKIADIAKLSNCSISTVSKALSDSTDINSKTKEEILKCAMDLGYEIGRKKANTKGKIAVVIQGSNYTSISFEYQMLFGFKLAATRENFDIEIINKNPNDHNWDFEKEVLDKDYSGAFILRLGDVEQIFKNIKKFQLPIVFFDNEIDCPNGAYIGCDNKLGIQLAVEHLIENGHQKIAFYGGTPTAYVSRIRKKSFIETLYKNNVRVYPELIAESNFSQNYADKIIPDFVEEKATAIVCASDLLAKYCIDELEKLGINVPNDISVIGFDNVPISEEITPQLTTIDQNIKEIGRQAFILLNNLINGVNISRVLFKPKLIIRKSVKKIESIEE